MLKNSKFYKYLGFALFACSAFVTMEFMWSSALGFWATIIASVQGTAIESCKSGFTYIAVSIESKYWKAFFGVLAFIAFIFSVIFTFGYSTNMNNQMKNNQMYASEKYAQQKDDAARQKDIYDTTKKAIDDLKNQRDNQVASMEAARDQLPKNFRSQRVIETDKINNAKYDYQKKIEAKESELKKADEKLNVIKTEELPEEGYLTMYQLFAKAINTTFAPKAKGKIEKKPWTAEDVEFWFQIMISLFLEFAGIGCVIYSQYINADETPVIALKKTPISNNHNGNGIGFKPQIATATTTPQQQYEHSDESIQMNQGNQLIIKPKTDEDRPKNKIGFDIKQSDICKSEIKPVIPKMEQIMLKTGQIMPKVGQQIYIEGCEPVLTKIIIPEKLKLNNDDLKKYLTHMYATSKNNKSSGYIKIANEIGLSVETCRKIKGYLENINIIHCEGRTTKILKQLDEIYF